MNQHVRAIRKLREFKQAADEAYDVWSRHVELDLDREWALKRWTVAQGQFNSAVELALAILPDLDMSEVEKP